MVRKEGLSVNPSKISLVPFARKRQQFVIRKLNLFGSFFKIEGQIKYLRVILERKLTFKPHLEGMTNKATRSLWVYERTLDRNWALSPKMIH